MKKKHTLIATYIIIGILLFIPLNYCFKNLVYSLSDSVDYKLFYVSRSDRLLKDDYLYFSFKDKYYNTHFIKKIGCPPGSVLTFKDDCWQCNRDELVCGYKTKTSKGDNLSVYKVNLEVPEGYYFMVGDHPDSYDSRYWGLLPSANIKHKLKPLI